MATKGRFAGSLRQQHRRSIISPKKQFSHKEISVLLSSGETFTPTGNFEKDFTEPCQRNDLAPIRVTPRPHRPSSPLLLPPETSMSKGKDSKEDRNGSHQNHQPLPDVVKPSDDRLGKVQPSIYLTKDKFEYFQTCIHIETEDEGNKTFLKELYIKGKIKETVNPIFTLSSANDFFISLSTKKARQSSNMRVYIYKKAKDVPAGYYILCLTKAEELQCSAPSLVHSDEIEEMWKNEATKEKFNGMAKQMKQDVRRKGSARLVVDWRSEARYEAVANRFASAKAT
eukprot:gene4039-4589_t